MGIFDGIKKIFTDEDLENIKDGKSKNVNQLISEIKKTNNPTKDIDYNHFTTRVNILDNGEDILNKISPGHEFELKRDKNNSIDPFAVAIFYAGTYIGVLKKEVARSVSKNIDKGINYLCVVTNIIGSGDFNYLVDIKLDAYDIHVMCLNCGRDVVIADEGIWNCSYCGVKLPQGKIGMTEPQRPRSINQSMNSQMNYNTRSVNYNNANTMSQQSVNYNMNQSMNQNRNYNINQNGMNNQSTNYNRNPGSVNHQQSVNYNMNQGGMNYQNTNYNRNQASINQQSVNYNRNPDSMNYQQSVNYNMNQGGMNQQSMNYNRTQHQNSMNSTMSVNYENNARNNKHNQNNYIEDIYKSKKNGYEDDFLNYIPEKDDDDDEIVRLDPFSTDKDYF